jgi:hypothetical protein
MNRHNNYIAGVTFLDSHIALNYRLCGIFIQIILTNTDKPLFCSADKVNKFPGSSVGRAGGC